MIVQPKTRGFICTTAHPTGCASNVAAAAKEMQGLQGSNGPKGVLVIGSSTGYGLASRIAAAFGYGAATVGVFLEKPSSGSRTASAGWYNNRAFEEQAARQGLAYRSINGDAFSHEVRRQAVEAIREIMPGGKVDLIVYSLASPKRTDPDTGAVYSSVLKPIGQPFRGKTVDFHSGVVSTVELPPATQDEIDATVKVMGGEDWLLWMQALEAAGVIARGAAALAYSYIGPQVTHAIYRDGTIGRAKADLEQKAGEIDALLAPTGGKAFVSVNKALVTQASAAIPVVPLYISLLFRQMKQAGNHEDCNGQIRRLFAQRLYGPEAGSGWNRVPVDAQGRIRMDDWELEPRIQAQVAADWERVATDTLPELGDLAGYRQDFFRLFGFEVDGVDYGADVAI